MARHSSKDAIFSLRTILTLALIMIGIVMMLMICLVLVSVPCVSNFYNQMPVYPDAELIEQKSSTLNWIAIGDLEFVYRTADELEIVQAWYQEIVDDVRDEAVRARLAGDPVPQTWAHFYIIIASTEGTDIRLTADCLN